MYPHACACMYMPELYRLQQLVSELYRLQKLVSEQRLQRLTYTTCNLQAYSLAHDQKYGLQRMTQYFIVQDFLSVSYIALSSEGGCLSPGLQPSSDRQMA